MMDSAIEAGELTALLREADGVVEDGRLWSVWLTGVSDLTFDGYKAKLAEDGRVRRAIASTRTEDVIAESLAISGSMLEDGRGMDR